MTNPHWYNIEYKQTDNAGQPYPDDLGFSLNFPVTNPQESLPDLDKINFYTNDEEGFAEKIGKRDYYFSDGLGGNRDDLSVSRVRDNLFTAHVGGVNIKLEFQEVGGRKITLTHEWPGREPYIRHFVRKPSDEVTSGVDRDFIASLDRGDHLNDDFLKYAVEPVPAWAKCDL